MAGRAKLTLLLLLTACSPPEPASNRTLPPIPLGGIWHRVRSGEHVADLARRYHVPASDIAEINGLERAEALKAGQQIFVPGATAPGSRRPAKPAASLPSPAARRALPFLWPVRGGTVTSRFGRRGDAIHEGIDIAAPEGTAVLAGDDGTVIYSGSGVRGYGNLILMRHKDGFVTVYAHNRRNLVQEGASVSRGQVIAEVGHTGRASGDHLHFEVRRGDRPVDPLKHVRPTGPQQE